MTVQIIGWIGTILTAICFLPQLIKVIKTKNTDDISIYMLLIVILASVIWIMFGVMSDAIQVWITNIFQLIITLFIFIYKIKNLVKKTKKNKVIS